MCLERPSSYRKNATRQHWKEKSSAALSLLCHRKMERGKGH